MWFAVEDYPKGVKKIIMAGVPIIASMAAPLFSGIECAKKYGLTLAGL